MRLSPLGLKMLQSRESCRLEAYQDDAGIWTIGWGSTGPGIASGTIWTQAQADQNLISAIEAIEQSIACMVTIQVSDDEWDALVSFAYNEGLGALHDSQLLAELNRGNITEAANQMMHWVFVKGEPDDGLYKRRKSERAQFLGRL